MDWLTGFLFGFLSWPTGLVFYAVVKVVRARRRPADRGATRNDVRR